MENIKENIYSIFPFVKVEIKEFPASQNKVIYIDWFMRGEHCRFSRVINDYNDGRYFEYLMEAICNAITRSMYKKECVLDEL